MLIALPNTDGSFTATLFLARSGDDSFDCAQRALSASTRSFAANLPMRRR